MTLKEAYRACTEGDESPNFAIVDGIVYVKKANGEVMATPLTDIQDEDLP